MFIENLKINIIRMAKIYFLICTIVLILSFLDLPTIFAIPLMILYWILMVPFGLIESIAGFLNIDLSLVGGLSHSFKWISMYFVNISFSMILAFCYTCVKWLILNSKKSKNHDFNSWSFSSVRLRRHKGKA